MHAFVQELKKCGVGHIKENELLANYTTWKIGGPASLLVLIPTVRVLVRVLKLLINHNYAYKVWGSGSNLLVPDQGFLGVVLKLADTFTRAEIQETLVTARGGCSMISLATRASKAGLSGLEFATGIPGTLGGAVYMNAGAHGSEMAQVIKEVTIISEEGKIVNLSCAQLAFAYRQSKLQQNKGVVIEAKFALTKGDPQQISEEVHRYKVHRQRTQPWQSATAGSVFRNPQPYFAAKLIEESGLKGYTIGGAVVSECHANFIVNTGRATAADVCALIAHIQKRVYQVHKIELVPEVEFL